MRTKCKCGWWLNATQPVRLQCGQCGRIQWCGIPGLGDQVASIIDRCGGRQWKAIYTRLTGKQCGCKKRQAWLNRVGERLTQWRHHG